MSDFDCFIAVLREKLSANAIKVLSRAQVRYAIYEPLLKKLLAKENEQGGPLALAQIEAVRIKEIVDFQLEKNKAHVEWTFKGMGLSRLVEDFYLVAEYIDIQRGEALRQWCLRVGKLALTKEEKEEVDAIADEGERNERLIGKVKPLVEPIHTFFIALCHALQEEDNELAAMDAYWFGLVDEIWGNADLFNGRLFEEYEEDKPQEVKTEANTAAA